MNSQLKASLVAGATVLTCWAVAPAAFAQGQGSSPPPERPQIPYVESRPAGIRERQLVMDEMARELSKGAPPRISEELRMSEIAEDYRELQQVNNKMMVALMRASEPDYDQIVKSVSDIRRRAERLRLNLAMPVPNDERKPAKPADNAEALKAALLMLDRSIMNFVRSPLFKNTGVFDAKAATKTGRDLANVIELSARALKDAEALRKKS